MQRKEKNKVFSSFIEIDIEKLEEQNPDMAESLGSLEAVKLRTHTEEESDIWIKSDSAYVNEETKQCFQTDDREFYLQLAVAAGNIYRYVLGKHYPQYTFGYFEHEKGFEACRFSRYIPGSSDFEFEQDEAPLLNQHSIKVGTNTLITEENEELKLVGLMAILALCAFFADHDLNKTNISLVKKDNTLVAIKLDPELAFSEEFFNNDYKEISALCDDPYSSELYLYYINYLFAEDMSIGVTIDESIYDGILMNNAVKKEFIKTLKGITAIPVEEYMKIIKQTVDDKYQPQIDKIEVALKKRLALFKEALEKSHDYESSSNLIYKNYSSSSFDRIPKLLTLEEIKNRTKRSKFIPEKIFDRICNAYNSASSLENQQIFRSRSNELTLYGIERSLSEGLKSTATPFDAKQERIRPSISQSNIFRSLSDALITRSLSTGELDKAQKKSTLKNPTVL